MMKTNCCAKRSFVSASLSVSLQCVLSIIFAAPFKEHGVTIVGRLSPPFVTNEPCGSMVFGAFELCPSDAVLFVCQIPWWNTGFVCSPDFSPPVTLRLKHVKGNADMQPAHILHKKGD